MWTLKRLPLRVQRDRPPCNSRMLGSCQLSFSLGAMISLILIHQEPISSCAGYDLPRRDQLHNVMFWRQSADGNSMQSHKGPCRLLISVKGPQSSLLASSLSPPCSLMPHGLIISCRGSLSAIDAGRYHASNSHATFPSCLRRRRRHPMGPEPSSKVVDNHEIVPGPPKLCSNPNHAMVHGLLLDGVCS